MKCDKLQSYKGDVTIPVYGTIADAEVYLKDKVDDVVSEQESEIAEKDKKIVELQSKVSLASLAEDCSNLRNKRCNYCSALLQKMQEIRRLRRALWIARAKRAIEKIAWFKLWNASISTMNPEDGARQEFDKWKRNLGKFLKKAEEYK